MPLFGPYVSIDQRADTTMEHGIVSLVGLDGLQLTQAIVKHATTGETPQPMPWESEPAHDAQILMRIKFQNPLEEASESENHHDEAFETPLKRCLSCSVTTDYGGVD